MNEERRGRTEESRREGKGGRREREGGGLREREKERSGRVELLLGLRVK